MQKFFALDLHEISELPDIEVEQCLAQLRRQIGLGIVQKGSDVILQSPFAPTLIIQKKWLLVTQHDVARLEIPVHKIIVGGAQQKIRQRVEVIFQFLLVECNSRQSEKVVLEIVEIPRDGLPVKTSSRIAHAVIQIASGFNLKARQHGHHLAIRFHCGRRNFLALAIL